MTGRCGICQLASVNVVIDVNDNAVIRASKFEKLVKVGILGAEFNRCIKSRKW